MDTALLSVDILGSMRRHAAFLCCESSSPLFSRSAASLDKRFGSASTLVDMPNTKSSLTNPSTT